MTGRQNLEYFASMYEGVDKTNIDEVVKLVKMSGRINDKVKTYSLGMCQRIGIAQALLHNPKLLVLDEPTNGLDPIGIKELRDLLKYLSKNADVGVFISSHLLSEMELMCDRIYIIDNGELIGEKTMSELRQRDDDELFQYTLETSDNAAACACLQELKLECRQSDENIVLETSRAKVPDIVRALVARGIDLYAVAQERRTLEQDFLLMTTGSKTQIR
jgi:ABC-2 type transport system ATP-binding protein